MSVPPVTAYSALVAAAVLVTGSMWWWLIRSGRARDRRLVWVYLGALAGAAIGAKLAFLLAEGWHYRGDATALLSGRSITGALLGGYAGVELSKMMVGYGRTTGDLFAIVVPVALIIGRVGCLIEGCCPGVACDEAWWTIADGNGVHRWPAAAAEMGFNGAFLLWTAVAAARGWAEGNRFHAYLIAYGVFRFGHEFARANVAVAGPLTGYHIVAGALVVLGSLAWRRGPVTRGQRSFRLGPSGGAAPPRR